MADTVDNPFYLHPSDNPGLVLVSRQLTEDNYSSKKRSMILALTSNNKIGFVDGSIVQPEPDDPLFRSWTRNKNLVASWLLNSITREITASVIYSTTAAAIWNDLQTRFEQKNGPRVFQLRKDFMQCAQGSSSVSQYYTRIKTLWEELGEYRPVHHCNCGGVQPILAHLQQEYVMQFLMGLNDDFAHLKGQVLMMRPLPSITDVFSLVIQDGKQRHIGSSSQSSVMPFAGSVQQSSSNTSQQDSVQ